MMRYLFFCRCFCLGNMANKKGGTGRGKGACPKEVHTQSLISARADASQIPEPLQEVLVFLQRHPKKVLPIVRHILVGDIFGMDPRRGPQFVPGECCSSLTWQHGIEDGQPKFATFGKLSWPMAQLAPPNVTSHR